MSVQCVHYKDGASSWLAQVSIKTGNRVEIRSHFLSDDVLGGMLGSSLCLELIHQTLWQS